MEQLFEGDVIIQIEQEAIHLKAVDKYGDPVELTSEMARELANMLIEFAHRIDD